MPMAPPTVCVNSPCPFQPLPGNLACKASWVCARGAGWGLDFVWPFLLRYPRDKIAVVDQVCMFHPPSTPNKANSVYNAGQRGL